MRDADYGGGRAEGPAAPASSSAVDNIRPVEWRDGTVVMIDQRLLPLQEVRVTCRTWEEVADAICTMAVRGAPALGVAAGMGMALAARTALLACGDDPARFRASLQRASKGLYDTRPTAVNLPWALAEMERVWSREDLAPALLAAEMERAGIQIYEDDLASCQAIGEFGADLITGERAGGANPLQCGGAGHRRLRHGSGGHKVGLRAKPWTQGHGG